MVICGLTACTLGSAPGPTLGIEYGKPLPLPFWHMPTGYITNNKPGRRLPLLPGPLLSFHLQRVTTLGWYQFLLNDDQRYMCEQLA